MRLLSSLAVFLCCTCLLASASLAATSVDNVRVYRAPEYTRFVFDVSEAPRYQVLPDAVPGRVIIDFRDAQLKTSVDSIDLKDSPVRRVRSGIQSDGTTRVVLDLAVAVRVNSFSLPPNELYGNRLVVDLYDLTPAAEQAGVAAAPAADGASAPAATAPAVSPAPTEPPVVTAPAPVAAAPAATAAPSVKQPEKPSLPPASAQAEAVAATVTPLRFEPRTVVVALDPGHGGEDPGARGPKGTREKDVVLAIARAVSERMRSEPGMRPVLVRDGDYYVGLKERRQLARKKHNADLFVSIHADAFTRREARGASVFAVSRRGASSTLAAYLADSENRADLVGGIDPNTGNDLVSVLSDMMMEGTMRESLLLGRGVLDELGSFARLHKHSVEQAGFMVLKEPNMPSILIETGFISNPEEERLLGSAAYQQRLAGAIVKGVRNYFERFPPPGTWFAAHRDGHITVAQAASSAADAGPRDAGADTLMQAVAARAEKKPARKAPESFEMHKVGKGQSLSWLAKKYGVSQRDIKKANDLKRDDLLIGETLKIPKK